ncbi:MAG TPA: hypothetical protein VLX56_08940 [Nitrososphaerales archaeon]|nr:hypothetical protein [Nitrososphaerales archaeon]
MRKITVALEDATYVRLVDYVAAKSKREKGRLSLSESASELISMALSVPAQRDEAN